MENRTDDFNEIKEVNGDRYIACGLKTGNIKVQEVAGNDCAAFMDAHLWRYTVMRKMAWAIQ